MIYTFYSFKGGVGRSMSMAAVAYLFAQRGLRVLAIDFDLEAPGLERYFFDSEHQLRSVRENPGLIDLVLAYKRALSSPSEFEKPQFRDWQRFTVEAVPRTTGGGSVDLMTAGQREPHEFYTQYALNVRSFDWQDFFSNWRGDRFFDWFRQEITARETGYDIVLVDSRTGVTEMGGVCAYQLADVVVLLCAPNYQNLDGTRAIVEDFRSDPVVVVRKSRPLEIVVVLARVEEDNAAVAAQRARFVEDFRAAFGREGMPKVLADAGLDYETLTVRYHPELAIIERVVDVQTEGHGDFMRLMDALTLLTTEPRHERLRVESRARLKGDPVTPAGTVAADVTRRSAGFDVFVQCASADLPFAQQLVQRLGEGGFEATLNPTVSADEPRDAMLRAIDYSAGVVACVGATAPSPLHWDVVRTASSRRIPVIPVLLPGVADVRQALAVQGFGESQFIDLRAGITPSIVGTLVEALAASQPQAARVDTTAAGVEPYPGPLPYSEDQATSFFGRDAEAAALLASFEKHKVVVLSGASAVGKTSLVHAGLLPRVRRSEGAFGRGAGEAPYVVREFVATAGLPDTKSSASAAGATLFVIDGIDSAVPAEPSWEARQLAIAHLIETAGPRDRFLLIWRGVLDDGQRDAALKAWATAGPIGAYTLEPMSRAARIEAIERPAEREGHLFEPGVVDRLLADGGEQPGAIAQIQIALADLWASRRRGWLTYKSYEAGNGIAGRYATRLDEWLRAADASWHGGGRHLLASLVQFDRLLQPTAQPRNWSELRTVGAIAGPEAVAIRDSAIEERLIDVWRDERGELLCTLAAATLPPALKDLAASDAEFILWRQRFSTYVHEFVKSGRAPNSLVAGRVLDEARVWLPSHALQMTVDERDLIDRSEAVRLEHTRQSQRRERGRLVGRAAAAILAVIVVAGVWVIVEHLRSERAITAANESYLETQTQLSRLRDQLQGIEKSLAEKQLEVAAAAPEEKAKLQGEIALLQQQRDNTENRASAFESELKTLRAGQEAASTQNSKLLERLQDLQTRLTKAQSELVTAQAERDALRARLDSKVTDDVWQSRYREAESRIALLQKQVNANQPAQAQLPQLPSLPAQDLQVPSETAIPLRVAPFNSRLILYAGNVDDDGTLVIVTPADVLGENGNYKHLPEGVVKGQVRGRCSADAIVSFHKGQAQYLAFSFEDASYVMTLRYLNSTGSDQYVTFDIARENRTPTLQLCAPSPAK